MQVQKTGCPLGNQSFFAPEMSFTYVALGAGATSSNFNVAVRTLYRGSHRATELYLNGPQDVIQSGESIPADVGGRLVFDDATDTNRFFITVAETGSYGFYAEYDPKDFVYDKEFVTADLPFGATTYYSLSPGDESEDDECADPKNLPDCLCMDNVGELDCEDTGRLLDAAEYLVENKCDKGCNCYDGPCRDNFFIINMHYSGCEPFLFTVQSRLSRAMRTFSKTCEKCYQPGVYDPKIPDCDMVDCEDKSSMLDNYDFIQGNCFFGCDAKPTCQIAWKKLIAAKGFCCESQIPATVRFGMSTFESSCGGGCNTVNSTYEPDCEAPDNM
uniref:Uncharacterized protein n=1 Tax=Lotharella oceanica TaxID=641309 RepID=A0A7S2TKI8_9EUKA